MVDGVMVRFSGCGELGAIGLGESSAVGLDSFRVFEPIRTGVERGVGEMARSGGRWELLNRGVPRPVRIRYPVDVEVSPRWCLG